MFSKPTGSVFGIRYFNNAGPNDYVVFTRGGKEIAQGNGLAGFLLPSTSIVVVPLGVKTVNFLVTERSKDGQMIAVSGEMVVVNTAEMRKHFDFSVFPQNGNFRKDPTAQIEDQVRIAVRNPIREKLAVMDVSEVGAGAAVIDQMLVAEVLDADSNLMKHLAKYAISVQSVSVKSAVPEDDELAEAIGAEKREEYLEAQDDAVANRRLNAAEKDREIREYEEATALELVKKKAKRVEKEGKNKIAEAEAEAKATEKKLNPFAQMDPGAVLAHALMLAAEKGLRSVSIDPGLLAAIKGAVKED